MLRSLVLATALAAAVTAAAGATASAASPNTWDPVHNNELRVTTGSVSPFAFPLATGTRNLAIRNAKTRAVERDGGRHARHARLRFRYQGPANGDDLSDGTFRRQLGLKLRAADGCNLIYVMWQERPERWLNILVKRNPGKDEHSECGTDGYHLVDALPLPPAKVPDPEGADKGEHELEAQTYRSGDSILLRVYIDGELVFGQWLDPALTRGLEGPVGFRSDNARYSFQFSARDRRR